MTVDVILKPEDFTVLSDAVTAYFAWGIGLGACVWMIGAVVHFIIDLFRY